LKGSFNKSLKRVLHGQKQKKIGNLLGTILKKQGWEERTKKNSPCEKKKIERGLIVTKKPNQ